MFLPLQAWLWDMPIVAIPYQYKEVVVMHMETWETELLSEVGYTPLRMIHSAKE